jgi:ABC-type uncharacterized transport system ATPase subunit
MTVAENIVLGAEPGNAAALDINAAAQEIRKLSEEFKLAVNPHTIIEHLSVGQQQRVELLKALYRHARLLILDEPTAVLTPQEVEEFFAILRRMREQGKTVIIITHKLAEVLAISDEVTVMRDGKVVGGLQTKDTNAAELARLMVGREVLLRVEKEESTPGATQLQVSGVSVTDTDGKKRLDGVSFNVRKGEIVGIAGVEGNGQTELIEVLAGLKHPSGGEMLLENKPLVWWNYPTGKTLRHALLMVWLFLLIETGILLIAYPHQPELSKSFLIRLIPQSIVIWGFILALKLRVKWAPLVVSILSGLSLIALVAFVLLSKLNTLDTFLAAINAILLIYLITHASRTHVEFKRRNKTEIAALNPRQIKELAVGHIPEDRHRRGLLLDFDLKENAILGVHYRKPIVSIGPLLDKTAIRSRAQEIIEGFDVRPANAELPARALSGGNQQKLIIGREFKVDPKLLLVSQPTRGVDIGAIEFIHRKLVALRDAGCAILLVSAELEEVTSLSDRLLVIHDGKIVGEVDPKVATVEEIGLLMTRGH